MATIQMIDTGGPGVQMYLKALPPILDEFMTPAVVPPSVILSWASAGESGQVRLTSPATLAVKVN